MEKNVLGEAKNRVGRSKMEARELRRATSHVDYTASHTPPCQLNPTIRPRVLIRDTVQDLGGCFSKPHTHLQATDTRLSV